MGLIDDLKKWAHPYEDEDEEYEDDFAELGSRDTGAFADERPSRRERDREGFLHRGCHMFSVSPRDPGAVS